MAQHLDILLSEKNMPIFEFVCIDCGMPFEELVISTNTTGQVTCPSCQSQNLTKKISTFASRLSNVSSYSFTNASSSSCSTGSV
jgi:putative FmdB family regulatory protein